MSLQAQRQIAEEEVAAREEKVETLGNIANLQNELHTLKNQQKELRVVVHAHKVSQQLKCPQSAFSDTIDNYRSRTRMK